MVSNEEIREFAESIDPQELPKDHKYVVKAYRAFDLPEVVAGPIEGYYNALYVMDRIEQEKGYIGVSFEVEEVVEE